MILHMPRLSTLGRGLLMALLLYGVPAEATTYVITSIGTGDFPTIQEALDHCAEGDSVALVDGVFMGPGNVDLDFRGAGITLRSFWGDHQTCVIDGQDDYRGIYFHTAESGASVVDGIGFENCWGGNGGAILCEGGASPTIRNCRFQSCRAQQGAGICTIESSPELYDCLFAGNHANVKGGGAYFWGGSEPRLSGCMFYGNDANVAGGIGVRMNAHCLIEDCVWYGNTASTGGAIEISNSPEKSPVISNCTVALNAAFTGSGLASSSIAPMEIRNTIFAFGGEGAAVHGGNQMAISLACCDVYGNEGGDYVHDIIHMEGVNGNISADPLFCDTAYANLTLLSLSPCLDENHPTCGLIGALPLGCYPSLAVESPNGGELYLEQADEVEISWTEDHTGPEVRLELLREGEVCLVIAEAAENNGSYLWTAAVCDGESRGYSIRITDPATEASDTSDSLFTIVPNPLSGAEQTALPTQVRLRAARPNPFADQTWIGFDLPAPSRVEVAVYSPDGRRAATLVEGSLPAGRHSMVWDGRDDEGRRLPSGIYWVRMRTEDAARSRRLVLLR